MTVHPFIEAEKRDGHNVKRACELLQVSRAAFYARRTGKPGPRAARDAELTGQITEVHAKSRGTYGAPRIHAVLKREGAVCGRRRIARLMRAAGLEGRHRRRRHLTHHPRPPRRHPARPHLAAVRSRPSRRRHPLVRRHHVCPDGGGMALSGHRHRYRLPPGSRLGDGDHLRTDLVADALAGACRQRRPARPVIFHSDRGCQYTSQQFASLAAEFGIRLSVGRTGQCWDNALDESFFATIKRESLDTTAWPSRAAARTAIFDFIEGRYNLHRLHSSLGYLSPADYEAALAA